MADKRLADGTVKILENVVKYKCARVAELVYAFDLKSNGEIHMGSSPISGTTEIKEPRQGLFYFRDKCG